MEYIVGKESPLRRLPENIEPRQRIVLDGIRYAAETIGLSYGRLLGSLAQFSSRPSGADDSMPFVEAFADAWLFVDTVNRLGALLRMIPHAEEVHQVREFLDAAKPLRNLRNSVQHIHELVDRLVKKKQNAWGAITWVTLDSADPPKGLTHVAAAGSMSDVRDVQMENPFGKCISASLDLVTMRTHDEEVCFADVFARVRSAIAVLEAQLEDTPGYAPTSGSDLYASVVFEAAPKAPDNSSESDVSESTDDQEA